MAVQIANAYGFNVKRLSIMSQLPPPQMGSAAGGAYQGEQVYVLASSVPNAMAVLQQQYGTDLGPVTGGTTHVYGALTTMTGS